MIARTAPMGWNSWNTFGANISDALVREMADAMVEKGYRDAGYEYLVIDDCWSLRERGAEYANAAMDKTKDAARLAKLTVSLTGEKDALKKAYIELGKAYYEEHHNDAEGLYAQLVEEVDAVNARIEEMQAEIDALKGSFHVSEDASFENVVAQDEDNGDEDISVEITVEEEPEAPAAETAEEQPEEHTEE